MTNLPNYIPDINRFQLAGPPRFFLQQLWDYDPSLVIMPSKMGFFYRLAQRRKLQLSEQMVNDVLKEQADTQMLASHNLVPITTILSTVRWDSPLIFADLTMKAPWRMGGAKQYEKLLLDREAKEFMDKRQARDDFIESLAKDAWKLYGKKIGVRSHMWSPVTKTRVAQKAHSVIIPATKYTPAITSGWGETVANRR